MAEYLPNVTILLAAYFQAVQRRSLSNPDAIGKPITLGKYKPLCVRVMCNTDVILVNTSAHIRFCVTR